jgi:FKBP-type peptidyl-prolyl cis-trans isomerase
VPEAHPPITGPAFANVPWVRPREERVAPGTFARNRLCKAHTISQNSGDMKRTYLVPLIATLACLPVGCKPKKSLKSEAATASGASSVAAPAATDNSIPAPADVAAAPANAEKTASGLASIVLQPATGTDKPTAFDRVKVHYTGWTKDGKMFDSSLKRKVPATFGVSQVIKGWTEGLQLMAVGEKRRFWIPGPLAYGDTAAMGRPSGQLTFEVELLEVIRQPAPPPVPSDVADPPATAERAKSGLASVVLAKGTGTEHPRPQDKVSVHYTGWTKDGTMFDSSVPRGKPTSFGLSEVIKGWTEGVQLMVVGEKRRFWIPGPMAYGDTAAGGRPAGQLTFDIELLEITKMPDPPSVPPDVAKAPASAKKTPSGLRYRVLKAGTGTVHPQAQERVQVHYSGWTTDGKMFDSSVTRNEPATFALNQVIKGWTEGVQLMVEGEKTRFWIPGELAYGTQPREGAPSGTLVFDIELLKIAPGAKSPH